MGEPDPRVSGRSSAACTPFPKSEAFWGLRGGLAEGTRSRDSLGAAGRTGSRGPPNMHMAAASSFSLGKVWIPFFMLSKNPGLAEGTVLCFSQQQKHPKLLEQPQQEKKKKRRELNPGRRPSILGDKTRSSLKKKNKKEKERKTKEAQGRKKGKGERREREGEEARLQSQHRLSQSKTRGSSKAASLPPTALPVPHLPGQSHKLLAPLSHALAENR